MHPSSSSARQEMSRTVWTPKGPPILAKGTRISFLGGKVAGAWGLQLTYGTEEDVELFFHFLIFLYLVLRSYATVLLHVTYLYLFPKLRNIKERPSPTIKTFKTTSFLFYLFLLQRWQWTCMRVQISVLLSKIPASKHTHTNTRCICVFVWTELQAAHISVCRIGFYDRDGICLLRDTNEILKYTRGQSSSF